MPKSKAKRIKPETCWCVWMPQYGLCNWTMSALRSGSIREYMNGKTVEDPHGYMTWRQKRGMGYRCVRVKVEEAR